MTNYTFEGKGVTLEDAMDDLYVAMEGAAKKRDYFVLPQMSELDSFAKGYTVSMREGKKPYVAGEQKMVLQDAYQSALDVVAGHNYASSKLRFKVVGQYDLTETQKSEPVQKGRPSGAGLSVTRSGTLTDLM